MFDVLKHGNKEIQNYVFFTKEVKLLDEGNATMYIFSTTNETEN